MITLTPTTNRERQLVRDHGDQWEVVIEPRWVHCFGSIGIGVRSLDGSHDRWVRIENVE